MDGINLRPQHYSYLVLRALNWAGACQDRKKAVALRYADYLDADMSDPKVLASIENLFHFLTVDLDTEAPNAQQEVLARVVEEFGPE